MFAVFRKRDFRSSGWPSSSRHRLVADRPRRGILVYRETGSALAVGLMLMATAIPSLFVGLLAGVFVDRYDRKRIMIASGLIRAVLVGLDPVPDRRGSTSSCSTCSCSLRGASSSSSIRPSESVMPEIATDEELAAANSFLSISSFGSTAVGFAAAGLLARTGEIALPSTSTR